MTGEQHWDVAKPQWEEFSVFLCAPALVAPFLLEEWLITDAARRSYLDAQVSTPSSFCRKHSLETRSPLAYAVVKGSVHAGVSMIAPGRANLGVRDGQQIYACRACLRDNWKALKMLGVSELTSPFPTANDLQDNAKNAKDQ